ncbi:MAG: replicative DNA helicase [Phycisphaerae bacterium]
MSEYEPTSIEAPDQPTAREELTRVPPQSIEAEACVLGSMLLDAPAIDQVILIVKEEHFYRPAHRLIFEAVVHMHDSKAPIDLVTAKDELIRRKQLDEIGGIDYLVALVEGVPNAANAEYYARIVRDKALLRELITAGGEIVREAYDSHEEAQLVVDRAEQRVFEIRNNNVKSENLSMQELIQQTFEQLQENDGRMVTGAATGFSKLDECTCGFQPGEMIILAARPSMGKTSLLMNMAEYISVIDKKPIAFFSLEMSSQQIVQRMLSSFARYDMQRMRRGMIGPEDWTQLQMAADDLQQAPFHVDDTALLTILELRAKARRLKTAYDIQAIFIDYLQLMSYSGRANSRQEQISETSRGIKALARELNVPVICAAQLNRGPADRPSHVPRMSDLRESGSIEQDADVIMLLHCEDYYHRGETDYTPSGTTDLIIAKQRNGPTDVIPLTFMPQCTRFEQAAPSHFHAEI